MEIENNKEDRLKHTSPLFQGLVKRYKAFLKENEKNKERGDEYE